MSLDFYYRLCLIGAITVFFLYIIKYSPGGFKIGPVEVMESHPTLSGVPSAAANPNDRAPAGMDSPTVYLGFAQSKHEIDDRIKDQQKLQWQQRAMEPVPEMDSRVTNDGYGDEVDSVLDGQFLNE